MAEVSFLATQCQLLSIIILIMELANGISIGLSIDQDDCTS